MRVRDIARIQQLLLTTNTAAPCPEELAHIVSATGALLEGHFRLQSGHHGTHFLRAGQLLYRPEHGAVFADYVIRMLRGHPFDAILAPQAAPEFLARPIAEASRVPCFLARVDERRCPTGELVSGVLPAGANILIVSDVVATGASYDVLAALCQNDGARVGASVALAVLGKAWLAGSDRYALLRASWEPTTARDCPACRVQEPLWPSYEFA